MICENMILTLSLIILRRALIKKTLSLSSLTIIMKIRGFIDDNTPVESQSHDIRV